MGTRTMRQVQAGHRNWQKAQIMGFIAQAESMIMKGETLYTKEVNGIEKIRNIAEELLHLWEPLIPDEDEGRPRQGDKE